MALSNPVSATQPTAAPPAEHNLNTFSFAAGLFLLFGGALVIVLIAYLTWALPGVWLSNVSIKNWENKQISVARGTLLSNDTAQLLTATDSSGLVVVVINDTLRAKNYPVISAKITPLPEGSAARLIWRSDYAPSTSYQQDLSIEDGKLLPADVSQNEGWLGNIRGVALAIQLPSPQSIAISDAQARPMDAPEMLSARIREWLNFPGWRGTSIYQLADPGSPPLSFLLIAALLVLYVGAGIVLLARRWRDRYLPDTLFAMPPRWFYGAMALLCCAWMVLDARWTAQLAQQALQTWKTYSGKTLSEKHQVSEDGALFTFLEKALPLLPEKPARVIALADNPYLRSRIAYHLYPQNVYFDLSTPQPPDPRFLREGDFILVFQQRGIQYDAAKKKIRLTSGTEIPVDALLIDMGSALFKITTAQP